jgi:hypothetical protein
MMASMHADVEPRWRGYTASFYNAQRALQLRPAELFRLIHMH